MAVFGCGGISEGIFDNGSKKQPARLCSGRNALLFQTLAWELSAVASETSLATAGVERNLPGESGWYNFLQNNDENMSSHRFGLPVMAFEVQTARCVSTNAVARAISTLKGSRPEYP